MDMWLQLCLIGSPTSSNSCIMLCYVDALDNGMLSKRCGSPSNSTMLVMKLLI